MITKTVQQTENLFIEFTQQELTQLGCSIGDKFSCKVEGNSIILTKYVKMELDMAEWPQQVLFHLIKESAERDVSVNEVIEQLLIDQISHFTLQANE